MKTLLLFGGLVGFAIGFGFSWAQESTWPASLWHACAAAYVTGLLLKWWGQAWRRGLAASLAEQHGFHPPLNSAALPRPAKS